MSVYYTERQWVQCPHCPPDGTYIQPRHPETTWTLDQEGRGTIVCARCGTAFVPDLEAKYEQGEPPDDDEDLIPWVSSDQQLDEEDR